MNKKHLFWIIPTVLVLIFISSIYGFNNNAVTKLEQVKTSLSNVESSYQRRSDVISGLVNTVKGVANFEQEVLTEVVQAHFLTLVEEVVLVAASEVVASEVVELAADGNH